MNKTQCSLDVVLVHAWQQKFLKLQTWNNPLRRYVLDDHFNSAWLHSCYNTIQ